MARGTFCWIHWKILELKALTQDAILKNPKQTKKSKHTKKNSNNQTQNRWGPLITWACVHDLYQGHEITKCHDNPFSSKTTPELFCGKSLLFIKPWSPASVLVLPPMRSPLLQPCPVCERGGAHMDRKKINSVRPGSHHMATWGNSETTNTFCWVGCCFFFSETHAEAYTKPPR